MSVVRLPRAPGRPAAAIPLRLGSGLSVVPPRTARRLRAAFQRLLPVDLPVESHLRGVVADTLSHPGSLARAQLAFGLGTALGLPSRAAVRLGIAVEYFHAASLIFDDMPAMDDAVVRRGRTCPHLVHGEAAAILGALALITRAYQLAWEAVGALPARRRERATALVADCLGMAGILDGQARDLHFSRVRAGVREMEHVAAAKTVPLLRLAIVLPALAAGATARALGELERLSAAWGLAYQILDDFKDGLLTEEEAGKSIARDTSLGRPNLPAAAGVRRALASLDAQLEHARRALSRLPRPAAASWDVLRRLEAVLEGARAELTARLGWTGAGS